MRYLPLTDADRRAMLAKVGVADIDALFADVPHDKRLARPGRSAQGQGRAGGRAGAGQARRTQCRRRLGALLRRRRRLQAPRAGHRRSPDPALGVPDLLHALSAGDRPGHAAIPVRVPDPGGDADGHGGGQCLHVRRLDGGGGSGADGASRHPAAQGGAGRQPASALSRDHRDGSAAGGPRDRGAAAGAGRHGGPRQPDRRHGVVRGGADAGLLRPPARSHRAGRAGACRRRAAGCRRDGGRVARARAAARRHGRRYRRRRGPIDRQRALLRRPLRRPVRHAPEIRAADAGAARAARPWTRRAGAASS